MAPLDQPFEEQPSSDSSDVEMTFMEHLEELRKRVIYILAGVIPGAILVIFFDQMLIEDFLLKPATVANIKLQNLEPFGQIFLYFQVWFIGGIIISIPNVFYQLWQFISPALRESEKKYVTLVVTASTLCFLSGVVFAYYLMLPLTLNFAATFGTDIIKNEFAIDNYMSILFSVLLGAGLIFELPVLSFILSRLGILTPDFMRKFRRHSLVAIMVLAAFLSPGTDPVGQIMLAIPLVILYELSIIVSKFSQKKS